MRVPVIVYLDLDPVPGSFHDQESCREQIQSALQQLIPHYNPKAYVPGLICPKENLLKLTAEKKRLSYALRSLAAFSNVDA